MAPLDGRIGLIYGVSVFLLWAVGTGADVMKRIAALRSEESSPPWSARCSWSRPSMSCGDGGRSGEHLKRTVWRTS